VPPKDEAPEELGKGPIDDDQHCLGRIDKSNILPKGKKRDCNWVSENLVHLREETQQNELI